MYVIAAFGQAKQFDFAANGPPAAMAVGPDKAAARVEAKRLNRLQAFSGSHGPQSQGNLGALVGHVETSAYPAHASPPSRLC